MAFLCSALRSLLVAASSLLSFGDKPVFQDTAFWNNIYRRTNSSENDWFQQWRHPLITREGGQNLADVIVPHLASLGKTCNQRLLHIGCGTSSMPEQMLKDGFVQQVCVDSSDVAMTALSKKYGSFQLQQSGTDSVKCKGLPSMKFLTLDAANTGLVSNSFDIVIDKGTLDAQVGGPKGLLEVAATLAEVTRLLRIGGLYVQISHSGERGGLLDESFDGLLRPWHLDSSDATVPFSVLAPIAYVKNKPNVDSSSAVKEKGRGKDTTYVYIYRKNSLAKSEL